MEFSVQQINPPSADGIYNIYAPGCASASLFWANDNGPLEDWMSFAIVSIEPNGKGIFVFDGGRAIPKEATHVYAKALRHDLTYEEALQKIPFQDRAFCNTPHMKIIVFSDLHLSTKDWKVRRALRAASQADCVLLVGDITNDGTSEQFERFYRCISEILPNTSIFSVVGNHDVPKEPIPQTIDGISDYCSFQNFLLHQAERLNWTIEFDTSGAYAACCGDFEIIGLNAVSHWRRFVFEDGAQLDWLDQHLKNSVTKHKIFLCHAPLLDHAFHRPKQPYLNRNKQLQSILDEHKDIICLSGHTHYSLNSSFGCAEKDMLGNIYINTGSVCPTLLMSNESLQDEEWVEGNGVELDFYSDYLEIIGFSAKSKKRISRAYYRFEDNIVFNKRFGSEK